MKKLVTIITLTYKKYDHLFETIDSVLKQDYDNIEYIISDDGSADFPQEKITDYLKKRTSIRFQVIHHGENCGTVRNINNACKFSHGEIIMPLSCGDVFFCDNTVSQIVERMENLKSNLLVTSRLVYEGDKQPLYYLPHRKVIPKILSWNNEKQYEAFITSRYWDMASGSAMYYSKKILEELNYFDEEYILWEDGPFLKKYLKDHKLDCAYDIISIWYESGGVSTSKNTNVLLLNDIETLGNSICETEYDSNNRKIKRWIKYLEARKKNNGIFGLLRLRLIYPDIIFSRMVYQVMKRIYKKNEIRSVSNNHKNK